ncbi:hypothetical protein [Mycobacterium sp. AZCC_0083]|nr:hypothetical protein [Mycobacterium sp. AZCC_0083]MBB5167539.1 hypothetical protein [Mycobacterium sp. AZCC_0083]
MPVAPADPSARVPRVYSDTVYSDTVGPVSSSRLVAVAWRAF